MVTIYRNRLQLFEQDGPKRFSDVVTGDECWISFFTMKDKHSNMVWVVEDEPHLEVLKTGLRSRKRMFTNFLACCCRHDARQSYNHCRILHNFSFTKSSSTYSVHGTDSTSFSNLAASRQRCSPQSSHYTNVP